MIAFDTNVLVRLMVEDHRAQVRVAQRLLDEATGRGEQVLVPDIVLCELEWVLDSAYRVPRERILAAVQALASDGRFAFETPEHLRDALDRYQSGSADLSDLLLGLAARGHGADTTYTFDRGLRGDDLFTVVAPGHSDR